MIRVLSKNVLRRVCPSTIFWTTPGPEREEDMPPRRFLSGPRKGSSVKGRKLLKPEDAKKVSFTPQRRLLLLDTWRRSGLPAGDLASLVGISKHTLTVWAGFSHSLHK